MILTGVKKKKELHLHITSVMERPSCWSRAACGAGGGSEVGGASSHPAPHTELVAIAEDPQGWHSHPRWTDVTAGTPGAKKKGKKRA